MSRGGARNGRAGATYANRTDLNTSLPKTAAPGQTYGSGVAQMRAQSAMPMGAQPTPAPAPLSAPPGQPPVQPGQFGPLDRPTDRPGEPLTAGAPVGPGPNSMSLPPTGAQQQWSNARDVVSSLAATNNSAALNTLLANMGAGQ